MVRIAKLSPQDRGEWESLFRAYLDFYDRREPPQMYDHAWAQFLADDRLHALGGFEDDRLVGITHFLVHASTSSPDVCYLQDLFTVPDARGRGVGRALIEAVGDWARERECDHVYWHARETNKTARRLYDAVADNHGFIMYRLRS